MFLCLSGCSLSSSLSLSHSHKVDCSCCRGAVTSGASRPPYWHIFPFALRLAATAAADAVADLRGRTKAARFQPHTLPSFLFFSSNFHSGLLFQDDRRKEHSACKAGRCLEAPPPPPLPSPPRGEASGSVRLRVGGVGEGCGLARRGERGARE